MWRSWFRGAALPPMAKNGTMPSVLFIADAGCRFVGSGVLGSSGGAMDNAGDEGRLRPPPDYPRSPYGRAGSGR